MAASILSQSNSSSRLVFADPDEATASIRSLVVLRFQGKLMSHEEGQVECLTSSAHLPHPAWLRSLQSFRTQIVRFRAQIALKRTFRPPLHRPPYRSNTDTAPRTPLLGTLVRLRRTRVGHALGPNARPYAPAQSAGTGSIYKHGLSLHAPTQSTGRGLNLQARFERRMLFRTPCGISGLALDPHGTQDSVRSPGSPGRVARIGCHTVRDGRPRFASCMGHRSTHQALDTARDPSCEPGCHMTSRVPRIAHSVHLMSPYEIPPPYGIPHQTHHPARDPGHLPSHTAIEPMITCGISGPGFNLEWGPVSPTTSDLPRGVSDGTPDPVRDHGSRIQSPMEPRIPSEIPHRIPHWVAVRPRPRGTSLRQ